MSDDSRKIYLQWNEYGTTWCEERINDNDVAYIKHELYVQEYYSRVRYENALKNIRTTILQDPGVPNPVSKYMLDLIDEALNDE